MTNPVYPQLMQISRAIEERLMQRLLKAGYDDLTMSLGPPIMLISTGRFRLNTLANKLGMSNQQCNQSLKPLERLGLIVRLPDETDARAKIIALSPKGQQLISDAYDGVMDFETDFKAMLGDEIYQTMTDAFNRFCHTVNLIGDMHQDIPFAGLAGMTTRHLEKRLMELTKQQGHKHLQMSFTQVLGFMPMEKEVGITISELALQNKVSLQAISRIANELEALGYIRRITDEQDKRVRRLQLTDRGQVLMQDSIRSTVRLDEEMVQQIGEVDKKAFDEGINQLYRHFLKPRAASEAMAAEAPLDVLVGYVRAYAENPAHIRNSDLERKLLASINSNQLAALQSIVTRLNGHK